MPDPHLLRIAAKLQSCQFRPCQSVFRIYTKCISLSFTRPTRTVDEKQALEVHLKLAVSEGFLKPIRMQGRFSPFVGAVEDLEMHQSSTQRQIFYARENAHGWKETWLKLKTPVNKKASSASTGSRRRGSQESFVTWPYHHEKATEVYNAVPGLISTVPQNWLTETQKSFYLCHDLILNMLKVVSQSLKQQWYPEYIKISFYWRREGPGSSWRWCASYAQLRCTLCLGWIRSGNYLKRVRSSVPLCSIDGLHGETETKAGPQCVYWGTH